MASTESKGAFTSGIASPTLTPAWADVVPPVPVESAPPTPMLHDAQEVVESQPPLPPSEPPTLPGKPTMVTPHETAAEHAPPESEPGESASVAEPPATGGRDPNYFKFPGEIVAVSHDCKIWVESF